MMTGRIVLITGAKGGLGSFVTEAFLEDGATVVGISPTIQESDFSHPQFVGVQAELSGAAAADELVRRVVDRFGRVDALVHLVGGFAGGKSVAETDDATLERMIDLNYRLAFFLARAVLPHMRRRGSGRVLAVASRHAVEPAPMVGAYSASKAALVALVRAIALENKDRCISANAVLPGTIDTPANRAGDPGADHSQWVQPSQIAALLVHLASDAGSQITGAAIPIYGKQV